MNIVIASGKGGTGKTTVAVSLARIWANDPESVVHLADCDVEAPNARLFLNAGRAASRPVRLPKPVIDAAECTACGKCAAACNYNALTVIAGRVLCFPELCHSCEVCSYVCPVQAVTYTPVEIGKIHRVEKGLPFTLSWGELAVGQVQAPDIIRELRSGLDPAAVNILDAAPGCGCAVRETFAAADAVVLVTEPTPFGLNDLRLAAELSLQLRLPTGIVINRSEGRDEIIEDFARDRGIPLLGKIPFERKYAESYSAGAILAVQYPEIAAFMRDLKKKIRILVSTVPSGGTAVFESCRETAPELFSALPPPPDLIQTVVISGKGGTGKTTLSAALAALRPGSTFFDADVDASNLPILLHGTRIASRKFTAGLKAFISSDRCTGCGECVAACRFKAIRQREDGGCEAVAGSCEGCGLCRLVCPADAVEMRPADTGYLHWSESEYGQLAHAFLNIGEENSGKLVTAVRNCAAALAGVGTGRHILGDGAPGAGCPVIAALTGCQLAIAVTEPTVSGIHDLKRVIKLAAHFGIATSVIINKADINPQQTEAVRELCRTEQISVLGEVPFDEAVGQALQEGKHLLEVPPCPARTAIEKISKQLKFEFNI
ncbi:MAG: 4Fe-4S binding protein [Victivallaceae bacterium]|nr:4Fe-4S binding protein [Victivallaceae bacterium]